MSIVLSLMNGQQVRAQDFGHTDVLFNYSADKIEIDNTTFTSFFPTTGISRQFQTLPGFASETDAGLGIGAGDELVYNVLSDIQFWADGKLQPSLVQDVQIRVHNRPPSIPATVVSSSSGEQPGSLDPPRNRIGRASESGDFHSDLQWFLESTETESQPPLGTYAIQMSMSTNRVAIGDSNPFYFIWHYGADDDDFDNAVAFFAAQLSDSAILGDFDLNEQLDVNDAELLAARIRDGTNDPPFDLDGDASVGLSDINLWISSIAMTWHGDVDLDGEFSSSDLISVFQAGKYDAGEEAAWSQGDWNADGRFDSSDLVLAFQDGGYEQGPRPTAVSPVPEPIGAWGFLVGLVAFVFRLRRAVDIG